MPSVERSGACARLGCPPSDEAPDQEARGNTIDRRKVPLDEPIRTVGNRMIVGSPPLRGEAVIRFTAPPSNPPDDTTAHLAAIRAGRSAPLRATQFPETTRGNTTRRAGVAAKSGRDPDLTRLSGAPGDVRRALR